jgi:hypothetical protein
MSAINDIRLTLDQQQQKAYFYNSHSSTGLVTACIDLWLIIILHTYVNEGTQMINTVRLGALSQSWEKFTFKGKKNVLICECYTPSTNIPKIEA